MIIENVISDATDFFHMDALSSAVPMHTNVDLQLTLMDSVLFRLIGVRVGKGYEKAKSRTIYRDLVRHSGKVTIAEDEIFVQLRARFQAHYLVSAGHPKLRERIAWLGNKMLRVQFPKRPLLSQGKTAAVPEASAPPESRELTSIDRAHSLPAWFSGREGSAQHSTRAGAGRTRT